MYHRKQVVNNQSLIRYNFNLKNRDFFTKFLINKKASIIACFFHI
mgnify:CR=1 FL=1